MESPFWSRLTRSGLPTKFLQACGRPDRYNAGVAQSRSYLTGVLATLGLVSGAGAVFAASCCVLPLVLGGLGMGAGLFSALELLADYRTSILLFSAGLIAVAWGVYFRRRGARSTAAVLAAASVLVVAAANWDALERPLLRVVRANR